MRLHRKIIYISIFLLSLLIYNCTPYFPQSDYPTEIRRIFDAPVDKTWESALEVIEILQGTTITKDKMSDLISFRVQDDKSGIHFFLNVYLKKQDSNSTLVYLTHHNAPNSKKINEYSARKYDPNKVKKDFFERLEEKLRGYK